MEHPFNTLLEKAKAAHMKWMASASEATKAMAELGDAIQEAEALVSIKANFDVLECRAFKVKSYIGDKQVMIVALIADEKTGEPYFSIELRTLTKTPERYGYDGILRRINGYFYIRNTFAMRVTIWSGFFMAIQDMNKVANDALIEYMDKKEKAK